ncbi:hypothetical protein KP509_08G018300 [Ceratopteris richardii]|uniref:Carbonic anhydrase n=1 Tax=Ceratopteris richardii TaxID=49495 RepID=A0A8T2UAR4_CERRI|nr:hypothetical protein KP509_08G018300 [Ceratopteris richardii]
MLGNDCRFGYDMAAVNLHLSYNFHRKDQNLVSSLAEGQAPPYMIIACCDSRVDPCTVLNLPPGEAFVLRNIGNMVPAYSAQSACSSAASAIEYAVLHLKVKHLVVMGHSRCGAVKALMGIEDRFK